MSSTFIERHTIVLPIQGADAVPAPIAAATAQDKAFWAPGRPVNIVRWGYITTTVLGDTTQVLAMDFRPTIRSDTARVNGAVAAGIDTAGGTLTSGEATAVGKGLFHNVVPKLQVDPGEEVVIEATAAPASGGYLIFIEYEEEGFSGGLPAVALTDPNRISNLTVKAS